MVSPWLHRILSIVSIFIIHSAYHQCLSMLEAANFCWPTSAGHGGPNLWNEGPDPRWGDDRRRAGVLGWCLRQGRFQIIPFYWDHHLFLVPMTRIWWNPPMKVSLSTATAGGIISIVYSQSDILKHEVREPMASCSAQLWIVQVCIHVHFCWRFSRLHVLAQVGAWHYVIRCDASLRSIPHFPHFVLSWKLSLHMTTAIH